MQMLEFPKLHPEVRLQEFDAQAGERTFLLTSSSGRRWEIPESCYRFLLLLDGQRSMADLQMELDTGQYPGLSGCCVTEVFEKFVRNCGLLESTGEDADGQVRPRRPRRLTLAVPLLKSSRLAPVTRILCRTFDRKWVIAILASGTVLQIASYYLLKTRWTAAHQGYTIGDIIFFILILLLCGPIHELGHLVAAHRYNCAAGNLGIGCYLFFPVMYIDLSAAWALPRQQRITINLGGLYFQFAGAAILSTAYLASGKAAFGVLALLYVITAAVNINPLIKLDGYWCVSDALGIPNLHRRARASIWHELGAAVGLKARPNNFVYHGSRRAFLIILGAVHMLYFGLVFLAASALLIKAHKWLHPHSWLILFSTLTFRPFTRQWWVASRRQIGELLLYLGLLVMVVQMIVTSARKFLIKARSRMNARGGNSKPTDLPDGTVTT